MLSLPMRGEWIEIISAPFLGWTCHRLSPCGESGLKSVIPSGINVVALSLPMRGEWIEIADGISPTLNTWSLPMRGEWIEIC